MRTRLVVLLLLSMSFSAITILPETARATTLYVGGAGPGNYTTIQGAIDAADPGDTVFVYSGNHSGSIEIDKPISLVGEDARTTIIDARGSEEEHAVRITGNSVNLSGFTVFKDDDWLDDIAILVEASNCTISDNMVMNSANGIKALGDFNEVTRNVVTTVESDVPMSAGIWLENSRWSQVSQNTVTYAFVGIYLGWSDQNVVAENSVSNGQNGISAGHSDRNTIIDNNASSNEVRGISLGSSHWNMVTGNTARNNSVGLEIEGLNNTAMSNDFSSNVEHGVFLEGFSRGNLILNNTILSNGRHGVYLEYSRFNVLDGNVIKWNKGDGVHMKNSWNNTITNNTIHYNEGKGIPNTWGNYILGNSIVGNEGDLTAFLEEPWFYVSVLAVTAFIVASLEVERRSKRKKPPW